MRDPVDVELPEMADELLELRVLARYSLDDPKFPPGYELAIMLTGTEVEVGRVLLSVDDSPGRIAYAGHLAYEIAPEHRGHHYAARACRLVRPLAREHLEVAWIMTAPDNLASSRTAELAGAEYVDTREVPEHSDMRSLGI